MSHSLDEILDAMVTVLVETKNLPEGFLLSGQERAKLIELMDTALDGPEDHKQIADILTVAVLDIYALRGF